jgi:SET domain-containing protein
MSIGWYMNHSDTPNVTSSKELNFEYFAAREIAEGEEIVCDYRALTPYERAP